MFQPQVVVIQTPDYCQKGVTSLFFFEQQNCWLKLRLVGDIKSKNLLKVGGSQVWSAFLKKKTPNVDVCAEKSIFHLGAFPNLEILLSNPPPLLQISIDFVLRQEVQNRFFIFSISLLNSIFEPSCFFRTDFHFKGIKFVKKVHN